MFTLKAIIAYPCRYHDLIHRFGLPVPELCMISNTVLNWIYENHSHRLTSWNNQPFLSPANLQLYSQAISRKGSQKIVLVLLTELYVKFQDLVITSAWCI